MLAQPVVSADRVREDGGTAWFCRCPTAAEDRGLVVLAEWPSNGIRHDGWAAGLLMDREDVLLHFAGIGGAADQTDFL